jgi:hypothetical protein
MTTALRLLGYGVALVLAFGAAWGVGSATGRPGWQAADTTGPAPTGPAPVHQHSTVDTDAGTQGLAATAAGYTVTPQVSTFTAGRTGELAFSITGSDGRPVQAFDTENDKQLHLVLIRRDTSGFQHLHPALGPDGMWRTPLVLPTAGAYRMFADFVPTGGPPLVLGTDLFAAGEFSPASFPASRVAQVDGYQVRLDGDLVPGSPSQVFATVSRDGVAVTDLQPYLGAFGHLVALRRSDLAYTHIHPDAAGVPVAADRSGPGIAFTAQVPTAGGYRLFLDFRHGDVVRTAEFTVDTRTEG